MDNKLRIGIDPGKSSYLCTCVNDNEFKFYQFPLIGKETDLHGINCIFREIDISFYDRVHAAIENVHAIFGSSANNTFEFGYIVGALEAFLIAYNIPFTKVNPKDWQKEMWVGVPIQKKSSKSGKTMVNDTKSISEMAAKRLFPEIDLRDDSRKTERAQKTDHNKVDSLLLTEYCRRKF